MAGSWCRNLLIFSAMLLSSAPLPLLAAQATPAKQALHTTTTYAVSLYGAPKYPADFKHFDYVNPNAPKGGTVKQVGFGSYDSFNPFALRGTSAINILNQTLTYDALMTIGFDERGTQYGLLAESVTYPDDYSWIEYKLRPNVKWHDGVPITVDDVVFTFNTMSQHASPLYRALFQEIDKAEAVGPRTVRITFKEAGNRRNLLTAGMVAIIPKHYWAGKDFEAPLITPPLTSGPYEVSSFDLGRTFTFKRVPNYWGKDLPVNVGRFNYDQMVTDYYRDTTVTFEAFKAGAYDLRVELSPKDWSVGYVFPAYKHGEVVKDAIKTDQGFLYTGFFYNLRRPLFQDPALREALAYAFDFKWMNKNLFYDFFVRTRSYFGNGELAAKGLPSPAELKLLEPYRSQLPPRVFSQEYNPPDTDGTDASLRNNLRIAMQMLTKAGYKQESGKLISPITHQPVAFDILLADPALQLVSGHWADNLKLLGVTATMHSLDLPRYIKETQDYDFDVIVGIAGTISDAPGREQRNFFGSQAADTKGSLNYSGIKNPVVDALLDKLANAQTKEDLLTAVHALDRVLTWNFYSVPHYASGSMKIAYWNRFGQPKIRQSFGIGYNDTWWIDPQKDAVLRAVRGAAN